MAPRDRTALVVALSAGLLALLMIPTAAPIILSRLSGWAEPVKIAEDDPGWDCRTMGNRLCGPASGFDTSWISYWTDPELGWASEYVVQNEMVWEPVTSELGDALAEGSAPDATTRDWEACAVAYGETTVIACPDGWVETT